MELQPALPPLLRMRRTAGQRRRIADSRLVHHHRQAEKGLRPVRHVHRRRTDDAQGSGRIGRSCPLVRDAAEHERYLAKQGIMQKALCGIAGQRADHVLFQRQGDPQQIGRRRSFRRDGGRNPKRLGGGAGRQRQYTVMLCQSRLCGDASFSEAAWCALFLLLRADTERQCVARAVVDHAVEPGGDYGGGAESVAILHGA